MQYDTGSFLYKLQYLADYEERTTVENVTSWSQKAINSQFCIAVQLQWVILKCSRKLGKSINPGEKQCLFLNGSRSIPSLHTYSYLSHSAFGIDFLVDELGGTRIWTQNSKYRMKELKATIAVTFFPPGPLRTHPPEPQSA